LDFCHLVSVVIHHLSNSGVNGKRAKPELNGISMLHIIFWIADDFKIKMFHLYHHLYLLRRIVFIINKFYYPGCITFAVALPFQGFIGRAKVVKIAQQLKFCLKPILKLFFY